MYRKILKIEKAEDLNIKLPDEYLNKEVELLALEVNEGIDELIDKRKAAKEAIAFFNTIEIDMSNFKFDRDEANER
jgi:hypothetical protein